MRYWQVLTIGAILIGLTKTGVVADRVIRISKAIAVAEGYGVPGAIPTVRNNPGNIRDNSLPGKPIATYPSIQSGWDALYSQVSRMLAGSSLYPKDWTLAQVAQRYTGEARYMDWANNVARILGVSTDIIFSEIP